MTAKTYIQSRIQGFDTFDNNRRALEEARNELEAFTYRGRDYLEDSLFHAVSNDEQREKFEALISETGDWLYGDGYTAPLAEVKQKLAELKALETPITKRKLEQQKRPEETKDLEAVIEQTEELIRVFTTKPPVPDADSLDDEEKDPFIMPEVDVAPLAKALGEIKAWLAERKAAQEAKAAYEDPAFTIKELKAKKKQLNKLTTGVIQQQKIFENIKQQAAKEVKAAAASSSKSAAAAAASAAAEASSASSAAEAEATPTEATPNVTKEDMIEEEVEKKDEIHDEL